MRNLFRRPKPSDEWLPLPYEQAILMPDPIWPDWSGALTADGQRFLALERPGGLPLDSMAERAERMRRRIR